MSDSDHDPSIEHEPFFRRVPFAGDPSEQRAARHLDAESLRHGADDLLEQSVWEEPALASQAPTTPDPAHPTYAQWLAWRIETTTAGYTWAVTGLVVLAAGPWAVLGAFVQGMGTSLWGPLMVVVFGPVVEEVMKVALPLFLVEKKPYLFRLPGQILLCCLAGGLAFAALENALYLLVYIPDASSTLVAVRWTVCVLLHVSCSLLAGFGITRMWSQAIIHRARPQLNRAMPWLVAAMVVHGVYNAVVSALQFGGWIRF